ncbi:MAG: hypothetical protein NTW25_15905 [Candidatus Kapabacteria bacterium]|nr:hypothetical protein [Candidatus Kapabacteria bacterium]
MKYYQIVTMIIFSIHFSSCDTKELFDGPNSYSDNFENYTNSSELINDNNINWSFYQLTYPENNVIIDTNLFHTSNKCLSFFATKANDNDGASKCSIVKHKMAFWSGDIVSIDFWYFIHGNEKADWLFIFDFEEQTAIGAGPGMRLALVDDALMIEHKYNNPNIFQPKDTKILFPRDKWVNIRLETLLSQKKTGYVRVWQDNILIINQNNWATLPSDILYFIQGTKGMYSSIEFGITANTHDSNLKVNLDDIIVKRIN